jgi:hypothetical protein
MKRRVGLILIVIVLSLGATFFSQHIARDYPLPQGTTYYDPLVHARLPLYHWQFRPDAHPSICFALTEIKKTDGFGWPLSYRYEANFGCPGDYVTLTPLAATVDFIVYTAVLPLFLWIARTFKRSTRKF